LLSVNNSKEEEIPIRMYLAGIKNLTPTMNNINNKFSVKYFLNLIMTDDQGRKYFKQNEIILYRLPKKKKI
jgi:vacuolar protein sorting-associated protein 26